MFSDADYPAILPEKLQDSVVSTKEVLLLTNFDFLKNQPQYALFASAAIEAEKVYLSSPAMCAVGCRKRWN